MIYRYEEQMWCMYFSFCFSPPFIQYLVEGVGGVVSARARSHVSRLGPLCGIRSVRR